MSEIRIKRRTVLRHRPIRPSLSSLSETIEETVETDASVTIPVSIHVVNGELVAVWGYETYERAWDGDDEGIAP